MSNTEVHNTNMDSQNVLITPEQLWNALPMSDQVSNTVAESRQVIRDILDRRDQRPDLLTFQLPEAVSRMLRQHGR